MAKEDKWREKELYDAMSDGEWDTVATLREEADNTDPTRPVDAPDDWLPPLQQYEADRLAAWTHYQSDNEPSEKEREDNTRAKVKEHNDHAKPDKDPKDKTGDEPDS